IGNALDQLGLVHLVGDLGDDDRDAIAFLVGLGLAARAQHNRAATGGVGLRQALPADDQAGGRKIRGRNQADQVLELFSLRNSLGVVTQRPQVGVLYQPDAAVDHFGQIVRRDVGGHADRDARRAV